jgi:hypothetical protein
VLRRLLAIAALAAPLALAPTAAAGGFERAYSDFKQDSRLSACAYDDKTLAAAEAGTPPDVEQYAPAFLEQVRAARLALAGGDCGRPADAAARSALARVSAPRIDAAAGASTPLAIWILAVVAGLAVLALLGWLLARRYGWSLERWTRPFAAAATEAGERTADLAREFWDWLRLGR